MSYNHNNLNNWSRDKNLKHNKNLNYQKSSNIIFRCEECKGIPLIIPSNINDKMIKYCRNQKIAEIITPINLLNMVNVKNINKKDISKDTLEINDSNINLDFMCSIHGKEYINYCDDCSQDICFLCSKDHFNHKLIYFSRYIPSNRDIREGNKILSEMKKDLEKFKQYSKEIIKNFGCLIYLKEIILNTLSSLDLKKLNFYSIMNYQNILKLKIKLNEKQYYPINPLTEINSNLLKSIKQNFENEIKNFSYNEKNNNQSNKQNYLNKINNSKKDSIEKEYQNLLKILDKTFTFDNIKDNIIVNLDNNAYIDKISNKNNKLYKDIQTYDNNPNSFLNLEIKNDFCNSFYKPLKKVKKIQTNDKFDKQYDNNIVKEVEINNNNEFIQPINKTPFISEFEKSTIMDSKEQIFIINLISSKIKKKIKKLYLCYKATQDGDKAENFHKKCDYIKNIIILIKTKQNKKFGGFSSESWDNNNGQTWKKDKNAFIFSLNDYNSYNIINYERALFCHEKYGPIFGNGEIYIPDNFFTFPSTCLEKNIYYESNENSYPLNGEKEFYITQLEAYNVNFESNNEVFK
jgi:hypothetical protein